MEQDSVRLEQYLMPRDNSSPAAIIITSTWANLLDCDSFIIAITAISVFVIAVGSPN